MRKRVCALGANDFAKLVEAQSLQITAISDWKLRREVDQLGSGSALCVDKVDGEIGVVWKSRHALTLLMPKTERAALMRRVAVGEDGPKKSAMPSQAVSANEET